MDSGVDPTTSLRQQNLEFVGSDGMSDGVRRELHLECREMLHHDRGKETIFT